jgi:hypothetical protein
VFSVTVFTALTGLAFTAMISSGFVFGFGVRECPRGTYQDGSTCIECASIFGDLCDSCSGPLRCDTCVEKYYPDPDLGNRQCKECDLSFDSFCLDCSGPNVCSKCETEFYITDGKCNSCKEGCADC